MAQTKGRAWLYYGAIEECLSLSHYEMLTQKASRHPRLDFCARHALIGRNRQGLVLPRKEQLDWCEASIAHVDVAPRLCTARTCRRAESHIVIGFRIIRSWHWPHMKVKGTLLADEVVGELAASLELLAGVN